VVDRGARLLKLGHRQIIKLTRTNVQVMRNV
jgi:hypothetical protein